MSTLVSLPVHHPSPPATPAGSRFMVGRQPIFDKRLGVHGYELLFRGAPTATTDGDTMTADVLVHAAFDLGLDALVGRKRAFVNATPAVLLGRQPLPLPAERTVIEILETVAVDDALLAGCRRLKDEGYGLALDDYVAGDQRNALLDLVDVVKLDLLAIADEQLAAQVERCARSGATLLAEKVETTEQLATCRDLGFELFQGYLLSRPETVAGVALTPNRVNCLRLLRELCDPDVSATDLERLVEADAGMSHRLLRAAGIGAAGGLRRPVSSIREAVVLLGMRRLRTWATLILVAGTHHVTDEHLLIAMIRARMCELLCAAGGYRQPESGFTAGLVSALDLLLGTPLPEIVDSLMLTDELVGAILAHDGPLGAVVGDVLTWEAGAGALDLRCGLPLADVENSYLEALAWANASFSVLEDAA